MLDGFRYLEERDASDKITRAGVVSKKSAFVSPDNAGIYDAIAKDLRLLAEAATSLADDADLQAILTRVKSMYDDMRTNPNFGSTAARAAANSRDAERAIREAQELRQKLQEADDRARSLENSRARAIKKLRDELDEAKQSAAGGISAVWPAGRSRVRARGGTDRAKASSTV